jgi:hypothetical protein
MNKYLIIGIGIVLYLYYKSQNSTTVPAAAASSTPVYNITQYISNPGLTNTTSGNVPVATAVNNATQTIYPNVLNTTIDPVTSAFIAQNPKGGTNAQDVFIPGDLETRLTTTAGIMTSMNLTNADVNNTTINSILDVQAGWQTAIYQYLQNIYLGKSGIGINMKVGSGAS